MIKKNVAALYKNLFTRKTIRIFNSLMLRDIDDSKANSYYQYYKLAVVLDIVFSKIPLYKDLELNFNVKKFSYLDFQKIPILTKDILRKENKNLINGDYKKLKEITKNTSGGSTGEPVSFFCTKKQIRHGIANYFLALDYNGVNINDTSVDLWGAERDMHNIDSKFDIRSFLHNKTTLNAFVLSDDIMKTYIFRLNSIKPKFIKAYVHSIYDLSKFINKNNIKIHFKPIIHCTTGPLYPEMRAEIKRAFNEALVYSFYGSREVSAIATEVKGHEGMHVLYDNVLVEILDENNKPVNKGVEGEIVITTLNNFYMPLLRYKIGDRAIKGDDLEFGSLKLKSVVGRTLGVIHRKDGSKIDGQFFVTLFFNKKGIKSFQLIQKSISDLQLKIVKLESYDKDELDAILERIHKELTDVNIDVIFCSKIELTPSGKRMYVFSEIQD